MKIIFCAYSGTMIVAHPLKVELLAHKKGLEVCKSLHVIALQIEDDSLMLVSSIRQATNMDWNLMHLWKSTMEVLTSIHTHTWTICYCKKVRECSGRCARQIRLPDALWTPCIPPTNNPAPILPRTNRTTKYTRAFYYHMDPASETSRIPVLSSDDSKSFDGRPGKKNARPSSTFKNPQWFLF